MTRHILQTLAAACLLATPVTAQTLTDNIRAAFSDLPQAALHVEDSSGLHIGFHDAEAARRIVVDRGDQGLEAGGMALAYVSPPRIIQSLNRMDNGGWAARVGFSPAQVRTITTVDAGPLHTVFMRLNPGASEAASAALLQNGYDIQQIDSQSLFMRGGEDYSFDPSNRDIQDPFVGPLGIASRIGILDDRLFYATSTPFLTLAMRDQGISLAEHPDIDAIFTALDGLDVGSAQLMQALVISDPLIFATGPGLSIPNPRRPQTVAPMGPWTMGLLVHVTDGITETAGIAFVFVDTESAAKAQESLPYAMADYTAYLDDTSLAEVFGTLPQIHVSQVNPRVLFVQTSLPVDDTLRFQRPVGFYTFLDLIFGREARFFSPL